MPETIEPDRENVAEPEISPENKGVHPPTESFPNPNAAFGESPVSEFLVRCWRCEHRFPPAREQCPTCLAPKPGSQDSKRNPRPKRRAHPLVEMLMAYLVYSMVNVIMAFAMDATVPAGDVEPDAQWVMRVLSMEILDTLLILGMVLALRRPQEELAPCGPEPAPRWLLTGLLAPPMFLVVLSLNNLYHRWLAESLQLPVLDGSMFASLPGFWKVLLIGVQPALVEELFFRGWIYRRLRTAMGIHASVWICAIMFGWAHLGVPLSVPILILIGVMLGYARVSTGGVCVPILLHFIHNMLV